MITYKIESEVVEVDEGKAPAWAKRLLFAWCGLGTIILVLSVLARSFNAF